MAAARFTTKSAFVIGDSLKFEGPVPRPCDTYCDCGTCGPDGAGLGACCSLPRNVSSTPLPPVPSGASPLTGACWVGEPPGLRIDVGLRSKPASHDSTRL